MRTPLRANNLAPKTKAAPLAKLAVVAVDNPVTATTKVDWATEIMAVKQARMMYNFMMTIERSGWRDLGFLYVDVSEDAQ